MRILANYGAKTNGDSYSVTFETMGDVPADHAAATADDLFRLAKEAVGRQITAGHTPVAQPPAPPEPSVVVPRPRVAEPAHTNGNGHKPAIKDPSLPASAKQIALLKRLAKETKTWVNHLESFTMGEASEKIDELRALKV